VAVLERDTYSGRRLSAEGWRARKESRRGRTTKSRVDRAWTAITTRATTTVNVGASGRTSTWCRAVNTKEKSRHQRRRKPHSEHRAARISTSRGFRWCPGRSTLPAIQLCHRLKGHNGALRSRVRWSSIPRGSNELQANGLFSFWYTAVCSGRLTKPEDVGLSERLQRDPPGAIQQHILMQEYLHGIVTLVAHETALLI